MNNPPIKSAPDAPKTDKPHAAPSTQPEVNPAPAKPFEAAAPKPGDVKASLLASFATGITKGKVAVGAAVTEPWSNGQTEGHVNRLKVLKRQMYGRAKIDLLEARLIGAV